jgi:hypothetical protein
LAGALIVIAELRKADFAWLDALRKRHYPPDRNRVPAHLTLFRALPPSAEEEARRSLARAAAVVAPAAEIGGVIDLDSGVALRVRSEELDAVRDDLADHFHGLLTSHDLGRRTPHVTIQNKVEPRTARKLHRELSAAFEPRTLKITGLQLIRYVEGQWEPLGSWRFR